jgi:hypothetical protein
MQLVKLKRLLLIAAVFLAGWRLSLWMAEKETLVGFEPLIWFYPAVAIAASVLLLAIKPAIQIKKLSEEAGVSVSIVFSIGWRVMLPMIIGFGAAQVLAWWIFYSGRWYYPQADDVFALAAFGCAFSSLFGAAFLIARQRQSPRSKLQRIFSAAPIVCFYGALFLCGGFTAMMSTFAMERFMPELVATAAGVIATAGICLLAVVKRPRLWREGRL